jgi:hypothetical protein
VVQKNKWRSGKELINGNKILKPYSSNINNALEKYAEYF